MDTFQDTWHAVQEDIITCRKCPRLVAWREEVAAIRRRAYRDQVYWGKAVPGFGDRNGRVLVVGLAPAAHGANRTGRPFTGDGENGSGDFLYRALHVAGFANLPASRSRDDGLILRDLYITSICRCAPPSNKPSPEEIQACLPFMERELALLSGVQVVVALGRMAFDNTLRIYRAQGATIPPLPFAHGSVYPLGARLPWLIASYHPSRQNTQTGRLTEPMFAAIWKKARELLNVDRVS